MIMLILVIMIQLIMKTDKYVMIRIITQLTSITIIERFKRFYNECLQLHDTIFWNSSREGAKLYD